MLNKIIKIMIALFVAQVNYVVAVYIVLPSMDIHVLNSTKKNINHKSMSEQYKKEIEAKAAAKKKNTEVKKSETKTEDKKADYVSL